MELNELGCRLPILNLYEWAGKKHFVSLNLKARLGFEPAISDFTSWHAALTAAP